MDMLDEKSKRDTPLFPNLYLESEDGSNDKLVTSENYMQSILLVLNWTEKVTLHGFRHIFINSPFDLGLKIGIWKVLLTNESSSTIKVYTHPSFDFAS